jgi:hypothetical protein
VNLALDAMEQFIKVGRVIERYSSHMALAAILGIIALICYGVCR